MSVTGRRRISSLALPRSKSLSRFIGLLLVTASLVAVHHLYSATLASLAAHRQRQAANGVRTRSTPDGFVDGGRMTPAQQGQRSGAARDSPTEIADSFARAISSLRPNAQLDEISLVIPLRSTDITDQQLELVMAAATSSMRYTTFRNTYDDQPAGNARDDAKGAAKDQLRAPSDRRLNEIFIVTSSLDLEKNITARLQKRWPPQFKRAVASGALQVQVTRLQQLLEAQAQTQPSALSRITSKPMPSFAHLCADGAYRSQGRRILILAPTHISNDQPLQQLAGELERHMLSDPSRTPTNDFATATRISNSLPAALVSCTSVLADGTVLDHGGDFAFGRSKHHNEQTLFVEKLLAGFNYNDRRISSTVEVPLVSPYCVLVDFDLLRTDGHVQLFRTPLTQMDLLHAGDTIDLETVELRVAVVLGSAFAKLLEAAMGDITMKEVSDGSSKLRDLVRNSYRMLMTAEKKLEEATARLKSMPPGPVPPEGQMAVDETVRSLRGESAGKRLAILLPKLKEATTLLQDLMKVNLTVSHKEPEESVGWELSLAAAEKGRRVLVAPTKVTVNLEALPKRLRDFAALNPDRVSFLSPAAEVPAQSRLAEAHEVFRQKHHAGRSLANDRRGGPLRVFWDTFCCHCCGFVNEIVHLALPLQRMYDLNLMQESECFCPGYPALVAQTIDRMYISDDMFAADKLSPDEIGVWISHRDPGAYEAIRHLKRKPDYIVGRSMYEFTKMPKHHIEGANHYCDEVWVPAEWVRRMFISNGVTPEKLVIIPESVDIFFFDPEVHGKMVLPPPTTKLRMWCNHESTEDLQQNYKFFSNFKWEARKGWEILFEAYFSTFHATDPVSLYVLTHIWFPGGPETYGDKHNTTFLRDEVLRFAKRRFGIKSLSRFPHFCFLAGDLEETEMVELYNGVDAFVLPTRGEGWGLPSIQAMAMGLPTISTNWGGQMEFLTSDTAFLIQVDAVEEIPFDSEYQWELGKKWAVPSLSDTKRHMRMVFDDPQYGRTVGARARRHIVEKFSEDAVAAVIDKRLQSIRNIVISRRSDDRRQVATEHPATVQGPTVANDYARLLRWH